MAAGDIVLRPEQSVVANVMLGSPTSAVTTPSFVNMTTAAALAAGGARTKWVVAIEGYSWLLTDADPTAAVTAHSGRDWVQAMPGLFVDLQNSQALHPWNPFNKGNGKCTLKIQPDANDTLGIDLNRMAYGAEGKLVYPMGRDGSYGWRKVNSTGYSPSQYVYVDNGIAFNANSDVHIGTECIGIGTVGASQLEIRQRGKYSPFKSGGTGGDRFTQFHRIVADPNGAMLNPVVSQYPRTWKGRLVGVWLHVEQDGVLNSRDNAQLMFAGRIAATSDDPTTGFSVIECEPIKDSIGDTMIGNDMFSGSIMDGVYLATGRTFVFADKAGNTSGTANNLTVVASGAAGANQINAGYYSLEEVCSFLNKWLAAELAAARILGSYTWNSPVPSAAGRRTKCYWVVPGVAGTYCEWNLTMPGEVAQMLGVEHAGDPTSAQGSASRVTTGDKGESSSQAHKDGTDLPWRTIIFRQTNQGGVITMKLNIDNQRGTLFDQYALMPLVDKPPDSQGFSWGYFLINDKYLIIGAFTQTPTVTTIEQCAPAHFGIQGVTTQDLVKFGKTVDDDYAGPLTIKQVFVLSGSEESITRQMFYSSGTTGYNHQTVTHAGIGVTIVNFDTLGYGLGLGIPGELLGSAFEQSLHNLPGVGTEVVVVIDEPTKFSDLMSVDYCTRWIFPRWKDEHIVFGRWSSPTEPVAVAALTDANKQEPAGQVNADGQRTSTSLTDQWQVSQIKIDYNRDITLGTGGAYQSSITFEDSTAVDDAGRNVKSKTLSARNTYHDYMQTGQGIESLMPKFYDMWPLFSRPLRISTRSIAMEHWEGVAVGDIVLVDDVFMRDPVTGRRGVIARPAFVTRHTYSPGGPVPGATDAKPTDPHGEVDLAFLDLHRYATYAPSALIDSTAANGGYVTATRTLTTVANEYSMSGEAYDVAQFSTGDRVLVRQIDPDSSSSYLQWQCAIVAISGLTVTLDRDLTGWSSSKLYQVTFDRFDNVQPLQQDRAFEANSTTGLVLGQIDPFEYTSTEETNAISANATGYAELIASGSYAEGAAYDVATDVSLIRTLNAFHDYKSAHQAPTLFQIGMGVVQTGTSSPRALVWAQKVFLGSDSLSNSVYRYLYVSPIFKLDSGFASSATLWVTITRSKPTWATDPNTNAPVALQYNDYFQTWQWTSTAVSTFVRGATVGLAAAIKDVNGEAWVVVEASDQTYFGGFYEWCESPRVVQT